MLKTQRNHVFLHGEQGLSTAKLWQGTELHQQQWEHSGGKEIVGDQPFQCHHDHG